MNSPELLSTIVRFRVDKNATYLGHLGRQVQAWFLREIRRHDLSMANHLHDEVSENETSKPLLRPYTLSTLYKGENPAFDVHAGDWCWVRITSLTRELTDMLISQVLPNLLEEVELFPLQLEAAVWKRDENSDPVTHETTYAALMHQALEWPNSHLELDFLSPTTFRQKSLNSKTDKDMPLPQPDRLFGSYLSHWRAFSGADISDEYGEFIEECLVVSRFNIHSERISFSQRDPRDAATGFLGKVRFAIVGSRTKSRFGSNWEHFSNLTRMLSLYSFYCGSGRKTTRGMGQTNPFIS